MSGNKGIVDIHGKKYKTVVLRVNEFRESCPIQSGWGIVTGLVFHDETKVVVRASIIDPEGRVVGSGLAEEFRAASKINKTSAMENAETSAIGRSLSAIGLGGEEYASADEVLRAINQQETVVTTKSAPPAGPVKPEGLPEETVQVVNTEEMQQRIQRNIDIGIKKIGQDEYKVWHGRVLNNMFGVDSVKLLEGEDSKRFAVMQDERIALEKGE